MRTQVSQSAYVLKRADVNELQAHRCMTPWQWTWFLCTVSVVPANKLSFQELNQIIGIKLLHSGFLDIPVFHSQFPEEGKCPFSSPPAHMSGWFAGHNDRTIKQGSLDSSAHFQRATMIGIGKLKRPIGDCRRKEYPHGKVFVLRKLFVEKKLVLDVRFVAAEQLQQEPWQLHVVTIHVRTNLSLTWYMVSIDYSLQPQCRFKHVFWRLQQRSWIAFSFSWGIPNFLHGFKVLYTEISRLCFCSVRRNCIGQSIAVEICFSCDNMYLAWPFPVFGDNFCWEYAMGSLVDARK